MRRVVLTMVAAGALAGAPAAVAGGPGMAVGAAEDNVRQSTVTATKAQLDLLRLAGLNAVRVTSIWTPGATAPTAGEIAVFQNLGAAADLTGIRLVAQVMHAGSKTTPLSDSDRGNFSRYAAALVQAVPQIREVIVGNEPNLNRFWLPQFGLDGSDAAAIAYTALLAQVYDAVKAASPEVLVDGGATSPRGEDKPGSIRPTHSPTAFITDMAAAYRASGRSTPIMDRYAHHPYQDNSSLPPSFAHPKSKTIAIGDYDKLASLLATSFDGTAQPGSSLPIVYDEFGVETTIPADRAEIYRGNEPASTHPVDEQTQGTYYRDAFTMTFCQPRIAGIYLFHTVDEVDLDRWQSGVYYANGAAKSSLDPVRSAARDTRGGVIAKCDGLRLTPAIAISSARAPKKGTGEYAVRFSCDIDCGYAARLERLPGHNTIAEKRGRALFGITTPVSFGSRALRPGLYRFTVRASAPVNVGEPGRAASKELRVG